MFKKPSTYKKITAKLILTAIFICILFGNGLHLHSVFNHLFDHGDIHAYVHIHSSDSSDEHNPEFDDKDAHQHPTATVQLTGTLTQKTTSKASTNTDIFSVSGALSSRKTSQFPRLHYLDLPPLDLFYQSNHFSSLSLRGPPLV
jgi:hypothetical protein